MREWIDKDTYYLNIAKAVSKLIGKHKKCKWCIYHKFVRPAALCCPVYCECTAKDKIINEDIPRPFCRLFALKKEE